MPSISSAPGSTGNGPLNKSEFYLASALQPPVRNLFGRVVAEKDSLDLLSERDGVKYRRQRRMLGSVYSAAAMAKLRPSVKAVVEKAILRIKSVQQDSRNLKGDKEKLTADSQTRSIQSQGLEALDIREWTHIIAIEALSASVLSWSPGFLRDGTDHHTGEHGTSIQGHWSTVGTAMGHYLPNSKGFPPFLSVSKGVYRQVKRRINLLVPTHSNPKPKGDARQDLLFSLIQLHLEKPEFTDEYLRRMAVTNFGAGHETLAATLTAALALIAMEPGVQQKVYEEMQLQQAEDSATSVDENTASANGLH
ncbi:Cytochrome P450 [Ceratocystis platani]|uniref:Cytochrome P450 n=1 Tax=Ceratocystis fimbriata f. sp. platani TaxID=88771 RepID=A0A0F8B4U1_CERFI|nr:Cytochrome P450 [Ceratocystis platani]